jgi:DNA-binding response OmpR family regulator
MRVLVVEDEAELAAAIVDGLVAEGWAVDVATDGEDALMKCAIVRYDVVLLDRDLPKLHGDDVCRELVQRGGESRVLMLTASGSVAERVDGLEIGADDYLAKPFAFDELIARVRALARRTGPARPPVLERAGIVLDSAKKVVTRDGRPVKLNRKELGVLEVLLAAGGVVVSTEELLDRVWDEHIDPFTNTVRVTVMTLRRKLGAPPVIETVVGAGYRIEGTTS